MFIKIFLFFSCFTFAQVKVVTTLPELAWLTKELGGEQLSVEALLTGVEDPHFVDASPSFIFKVSKAQLVIMNGMELEVGWLPKVLQSSNNGKVQIGSTGLCDASRRVVKKEIITNYDRSMGDIHPGGNPHYTLSLLQMKNAASSILDCLVRIDPSNTKIYKSNLEKLSKKFDENIEVNAKSLSVLKDKKFITYHREFSYFLEDNKLTSIGTIEKTPGILPSSSHLQKLSKQVKTESLVLALSSTTNPKKYLERFKEITTTPFVRLPLHLTSDFKSYWEFHNFITEAILKNAQVK